MQFFSTTTLLAILTLSTTILSTPVPLVPTEGQNAVLVAREGEEVDMKVAYLWFKNGGNTKETDFKLWFPAAVTGLNAKEVLLPNVKAISGVGLSKSSVWLGTETLKGTKKMRYFVVGTFAKGKGEAMLAEVKKAVSKATSTVNKMSAQTFNTKPPK